MSRSEIDKVLVGIQYNIDFIEYRYNKYPNKIILGVEVFDNIKYYYIDYIHLQQFVDNNNDVIFKLYGIPVMIDYNNPKNVEVCMCFEVEVNDESICNR